MFWNGIDEFWQRVVNSINRKHEMFWNASLLSWEKPNLSLTVNMKCFEILGLEPGTLGQCYH